MKGSLSNLCSKTIVCSILCIFGKSFSADTSVFDPPSEVYAVAQATALIEESGDATIGTPIRYYDNVNCMTLRQAPESVLSEMHPAHDTSRIYWYVPIYRHEILKGVLKVYKYPKENRYVAGGYNLDYLAFAVAEASVVWPLSSGYHPRIVDCIRYKMLNVPEAPFTNLTILGADNSETDTSSLCLKTASRKKILAKRATRDEDVRRILWEFGREDSVMARNQGLQKKRVEESDFRNLQPANRTIQWLNSRPYQGR